MSNKRIYAKIMRYLERRVGSSKQWDFRTLRLSHPQLADALRGIMLVEYSGGGDATAEAVEHYCQHYVPHRIWEQFGW